MATFTGYSALSPIGSVTHDSSTSSFINETAVFVPALQNVNQSNNIISDHKAAGQETYGLFSPASGQHTGHNAGSFRNDYYYRVHVSPNPLDLGSVLSTTTTDIEVWNAYFQDNTLASITETNTDGMTLIEPVVTPYVFKGLEFRTYQISVTTDGPAIVNGQYDFNFSLSALTLQVSGSRVTTFPFEPQWYKRIKERLEWSTDVMTAYDGSEQRVSLRREPRRTIEYDVTLNKADNQRADAMLVDWLARPFAVPMWMFGSKLTTAASISDLIVYLDTDNKDFVVGNSIVFLTDSLTFETSEVVGITSTSITVDTALLNNHEVGTKVYPIRIGRLQKKHSNKFLTRDADTSKMSFSFTKNDNVTSTESPNLYRSLPILEDRPNYSGPLKTDYEVKVTSIDNLFAEPYFDVESDHTKITSTFIWLKKSKADIHSLREWLHARRGKLNPIWVPTWKHDLTLVKDEVTGSTLLRVTHTYRTLHVDGTYNRRDIMILMKGGSISYHRVSSSSIVVPGTEDLALTTSLPFDVAASDVDLICYLEMCRLSADAVEFEWITPDAVKLSVNFTTLYDDV